MCLRGFLVSSEERPGRDVRPVLLRGDCLGLALMRQEDVPTIARWNQDLEFTARIGSFANTRSARPLCVQGAAARMPTMFDPGFMRVRGEDGGHAVNRERRSARQGADDGGRLANPPARSASRRLAARKVTRRRKPGQ